MRHHEMITLEFSADVSENYGTANAIDQGRVVLSAHGELDLISTLVDSDVFSIALRRVASGALNRAVGHSRGAFR